MSEELVLADADPAELDTEWSGKVASMVRRAMDVAMNESDRSKWAESNHLGVSDIGTCHEYVRRMIVGVPWSDQQNAYTASAFIGTAIGDHVERALLHAFGTAHVDIQHRVVVRLRIRGYEFDLPGTADIILTADGGLIDVKTKDGLGVVRRTALTLQQKFQLVLYAWALIQEGVLTEDCKVACAFIDRSGREADPYVYGFAWSHQLLAEAVAWMDDVLYAVENGEVAQKDPPREFCYATCPYASDCRGGDTDVEGLLMLPEIVEAARIYRESLDIIKAAEKDKASAASVLQGVQGSTGEFTIRWIDIPASTFTVNKRAHQRIDIKPVRRDK